MARRTVLDVHHAILPVTARLKPDSTKLLAASRPLAGEPRLRVLAPVDMVLHSATHLFCNEDVGNGLRDLVDLDGLLRGFGGEPGFWSDLTARAAEMDLTRPLYYALRYLPPILDTPIPAQTLREAEIGRPPRVLRGLMDRIFLRTLQPDRSGPADGWASLARGSIYVRAHWLRMPPLLLARHLTIKALRREEEKPEYALADNAHRQTEVTKQKPRHAGGVDVMQDRVLLALLATAREAQGGQPDAEESERGRLGNASGYAILDDDVGNRRDCGGAGGD